MTSKIVAASEKRKPPAAGMGRPKGSMNKINAVLKDAILQAAIQAGGDEGQDGLVAYLTKQADENPTAFMGLLGKVLPLQLSGDVENPVRVQMIKRVIVRPERRSHGTPADEAENQFPTA